MPNWSVKASPKRIVSGRVLSTAAMKSPTRTSSGCMSTAVPATQKLVRGPKRDDWLVTADL